MSGTVGTKSVPLFQVGSSPCPSSRRTAMSRSRRAFVPWASTEGLSEALLLRRMAVTVIAGQEGAGATLPASEMRGGQGGRGSLVMLRFGHRRRRRFAPWPNPKVTPREPGSCVSCAIGSNARCCSRKRNPPPNMMRFVSSPRSVAVAIRRAFLLAQPRQHCQRTRVASRQYTSFLTRKVQPAELFGRAAEKLPGKLVPSVPASFIRRESFSPRKKYGMPYFPDVRVIQRYREAYPALVYFSSIFLQRAEDLTRRR